MSLFHHVKKSEQLEHITHEIYRQNWELTERNKTLTILRHIDEIVLNPKVDAAKTAQAITDELVNQQEFNLAMIYTLDQKSSLVTLQALSLTERPQREILELLQSELKAISVSPLTDSTFAHVARSMQIYVASGVRNFKQGLNELTNTQLMSGLKIGSLFVCPLQANNRLVGIMVLGMSVGTDGISNYQKNLAERLKVAVSIAIENRLLYLELQDATARLQQQNVKLKAMDEHKDEFISMASHQLRTPLTTIKGYLSMVLEGDVGPINDIEREMLKKAFDGSQKMVYLISDLLNVSRLQSGKFIIDNKPVNLIELVANEASELEGQAKAHNLKVVFNKPASFPTLMLDENKIRQVVMNFLDNAIFYTKPGGQIIVELKLTETDAIFTVTDTGIGVPPNLQHNLFTKYYRADNAKKQRPDGTGIGLFVAKKIIAAQGGAIIFKSVEGKGSTFGFSFPLKTMTANLPAPAAAPTAAKPIIQRPIPAAPSLQTVA